MKLYKFYKSNCVPCYTLGRILNTIKIPDGIELVELNVDFPENKELAKSYGAKKVPFLVFEDNSKSIEGSQTRESVIDFLKV